jgi:hypothetical protein
LKIKKGSIVIGVVIVIQTELLGQSLPLRQRARSQNDSVAALLRFLIDDLTLLLVHTGRVLILVLLMRILAATVDLGARTIDSSIELVGVLKLLNWKLVVH